MRPLCGKRGWVPSVLSRCQQSRGALFSLRPRALRGILGNRMCPEQGVQSPFYRLGREASRRLSTKNPRCHEGGGRAGVETPCPSFQGGSGDASDGIGALCSHTCRKGRATRPADCPQPTCAGNSGHGVTGGKACRALAVNCTVGRSGAEPWGRGWPDRQARRRGWDGSTRGTKDRN